MNVVSFRAPVGIVAEHETMIVAALRLWKGWSLSAPPTGSTGDPVADQRLADAFRDLLALPDAEARLLHIERAVFSSSDFPAPGAPTDHFRVVMTQWWLAIFDASRPCQRCEGLGKVVACTRWPGCGCADGTLHEACPGESVPCPACSPEVGHAH